MNLTDRYLAAVRWNLPAEKADDIVAELADLIAARIEDREEALGRPLREAEVSALLKEFGHPFAVAGRYHGQRSLIGPELFPFYWFVLRVILAIALVIELIQAAGRLVVSSQPFGQSLMQGLHGTVETLLVNAAWVTLAFAIVEWTGMLETYLERWKPESLPDLSGWRMPSPPKRRRRPWQGHPQREAIGNLIFGAAFLIWWFGGFGIPVFPHDAGVIVRPAPVWALLTWPVAAVIAARMLQALITLVRPSWRSLRAALVIGCSAGGIAVMAALYRAGEVVTIIGTGAHAEQAAKIQAGLDKGLGIALIAVVAVTVVQLCVELWGIYREGR
jgi:hypothetical protein